MLGKSSHPRKYNKFALQEGKEIHYYVLYVSGININSHSYVSCDDRHFGVLGIESSFVELCVLFSKINALHIIFIPNNTYILALINTHNIQNKSIGVRGYENHFIVYIPQNTIIYTGVM